MLELLAAATLLCTVVIAAYLALRRIGRHEIAQVFERIRSDQEQRFERLRRVDLVAELLADWLFSAPRSIASWEQQRKVSKLKIAASLYLPTELVVEINKLFRNASDAKSLLDILLVARRTLGEDALLGPDDLLLLPDEAIPNRRYDFFISYSHARYALHAQGLFDELKRRGQTVWMDRKELPETLENLVLAQELMTAVRKSEFLLFLDLQHWLAKNAIAMTTQGPATVPLLQLGSSSTPWQKFERLFNKRVIDINPPTGTIRFGGPPDNFELSNDYSEITYTSTTDAVDKILRFLGKSTDRI